MNRTGFQLDERTWGPWSVATLLKQFGLKPFWLKPVWSVCVCHQHCANMQLLRYACVALSICLSFLDTVVLTQVSLTLVKVRLLSYVIGTVLIR